MNEGLKSVSLFEMYNITRPTDNTTTVPVQANIITVSDKKLSKILKEEYLKAKQGLISRGKLRNTHTALKRLRDALTEYYGIQDEYMLTKDEFKNIAEIVLFGKSYHTAQVYLGIYNRYFGTTFRADDFIHVLKHDYDVENIEEFDKAVEGIKKIINRGRTEEILLMSLIAFSGIRGSEAVEITAKQINFSNRSILVVRKKKKNRSNPRANTTITFFPQFVEPLLKEQLAKHNFERLFEPNKTLRTEYYLVKRLSKVGAPPRLLRHFFAQYSGLHEIPLHITEYLMGHKLSIVMSNYANLVQSKYLTLEAKKHYDRAFNCERLSQYIPEIRMLC